ncbi:DUF2894 domain-containing protein [Achromobacter seleniivolatilans]|uniref:DUF2894 domain-containing protein n=1 Tax=Achromobacter seleniivolatilans TaxID=3047478 RepID=A0ABY9M553_9BURK|nr:DUF2894 domain-containing protein [Achromobacter sp. R39]WMD21709.1 DUF2894 domain-containing protein [Achromobacter sp. R39]
MSSDGTRMMDARATLNGWREAGCDRANPVRFQFLDAMERRSAKLEGPARQLLDDRLAALIQAYQAQLDKGQEDIPDVPALDAPADTASAPASGTLAELIDYIANPASPDGQDAGIRDALGLRAAYPDLPMLDYFRAIWSRVSADRQVRQSQEQVHKNAGPLNSNQLVHRGLSLMREVSPGYLQHFLAYTDALIWMEQLNAATAPAPKESARAGSAKKTTRAKSR